MLDNDISTAGALRHLTSPEAAFTRDEAHALDRRRFLQLVGMGLGAGAVAGPGLSLLDTAFVGGNTSWAAGPVAADDGILLVIGMLAHQAPRILKVGTCISETIVSTGNSIVAGCQASVSFARGLLWN